MNQDTIETEIAKAWFHEWTGVPEDTKREITTYGMYGLFLGMFKIGFLSGLGAYNTILESDASRCIETDKLEG